MVAETRGYRDGIVTIVVWKLNRTFANLHVAPVLRLGSMTGYARFLNLCPRTNIFGSHKYN